jgi:hypothetical protein
MISISSMIHLSIDLAMKIDLKEERVEVSFVIEERE